MEDAKNQGPNQIKTMPYKHSFSKEFKTVNKLSDANEQKFPTSKNLYKVEEKLFKEEGTHPLPDNIHIKRQRTMNGIKTPRFESLLSKEEITNFKKKISKENINIEDFLKIREIKKITEEEYQKLKYNILDGEFEINYLKQDILNFQCEPLNEIIDCSAVGSLLPLSYLIESTYDNDPLFIDDMNTKYRLFKPYIYNYRTILGDGNCFYRAIMFRYFEILILNKNVSLLKNVLNDMKESFESEEIQKRKKIKINTTLNTKLVLKMIVLIIEMLQKKFYLKITHLLFVKCLTICPSFDYGLIIYFRYIFYDYIKKNENKLYIKSFPLKIGNLLPSNYETEEGEFLFKEFYENYMLKMFTDAEKIIIYLTPFVLGININVIVFDDKENDIIKKITHEGCEYEYNFGNDVLYVLNKMNHYEVLYSKEDYNKNKIIFSDYVNNILPNFLVDVEYFNSNSNIHTTYYIKKPSKSINNEIKDNKNINDNYNNTVILSKSPNGKYNKNNLLNKNEKYQGDSNNRIDKGLKNIFNRTNYNNNNENKIDFGKTMYNIRGKNTLEESDKIKERTTNNNTLRSNEVTNNQNNNKQNINNENNKKIISYAKVTKYEDSNNGKKEIEEKNETKKIKETTISKTTKINEPNDSIRKNAFSPSSDKNKLNNPKNNNTTNKFYVKNCMICKANYKNKAGDEMINNYCYDCLEDEVINQLYPNYLSFISYWLDNLSKYDSQFIKQRFDEFKQDFLLNINNKNISLKDILKEMINKSGEEGNNETLIFKKIMNEVKKKFCVVCGNEYKNKDIRYIIPCGCSFCSIDDMKKYFHIKNKLKSNNYVCVCSYEYNNVELYELGLFFKKFRLFSLQNDIIEIFNNLLKAKCCCCFKSDDAIYRIKYKDTDIDVLGDNYKLKHYFCKDCFYKLMNMETFECFLCDRIHVFLK